MESGTMRHFTKEEQKKYTESILKLYKPTGGNIMDYTITTSDDLELEQLMAEVIKSDMKDEMKVKVIKRLCNPKVTYIPYHDGNEWEPIATYVSNPTTGEPCVNPGYVNIGDPVENQPHTVCSAHEAPIPMSAEVDGRPLPWKGEMCPKCNGRGMVAMGEKDGVTLKGLVRCSVCGGKGYVENKERR